MSRDSKHDQDDERKDLVDLGTEILGGGLTGAAAGFLIGGPAGSAVGGALGPVVKRGFREITNRILSRREQVRVSAATQFVIERYEAMIAAGQTPRNDLPSGKASDELLEGVLQKARNSYQEKKVRLLANIFADFAFLKGLQVEEAQAVLSLVEGMTYRQLVVLEVFNAQKGKGLRVGDYRGQNPGTLAKLSVLEDAYQLALKGLIVNRKEGETSSNFMLGWHDVDPANMKLTPLGTLVCGLAGTDVIPDDDREPVIKMLST